MIRHFRRKDGSLSFCLFLCRDAVLCHVHRRSPSYPQSRPVLSLKLYDTSQDKIEILTWHREGEMIRGLAVVGRKEHKNWGMFLGRWRTYRE